MIIFIAIGAFVATVLGGLFALRVSDKLPLILGFSAGAVIAVAFFDLIPEALNLAHTFSASVVMTYVAIVFVTYMFIDRFVTPHAHEVEHCENDSHETSNTPRKPRRVLHVYRSLCFAPCPRSRTLRK